MTLPGAYYTELLRTRLRERRRRLRQRRAPNANTTVRAGSRARRRPTMKPWPTRTTATVSTTGRRSRSTLRSPIAPAGTTPVRCPGCWWSQSAVLQHAAEHLAEYRGHRVGRQADGRLQRVLGRRRPCGLGRRRHAQRDRALRLHAVSWRLGLPERIGGQQPLELRHPAAAHPGDVGCVEPYRTMYPAGAATGIIPCTGPAYVLSSTAVPGSDGVHHDQRDANATWGAKTAPIATFPGFIMLLGGEIYQFELADAGGTCRRRARSGRCATTSARSPAGAGSVATPASRTRSSGCRGRSRPSTPRSG